MLSRLSLLAPRAVLRSASMSARNVMVRMPMRFPAMRVQIGLLTFFAAEHLFKAAARCSASEEAAARATFPYLRFTT